MKHSSSVRSTFVPLALLALALPLVACVSDKGESVGGGATLEKTRGAVVSGSLDAVWSVTKSTVARMGSAYSVDEGRRVASANYAGARVAVRCEPYDEQRTILRVSAISAGVEDPDVADAVQLEIQRALLR